MDGSTQKVIIAAVCMLAAVAVIGWSLLAGGPGSGSDDVYFYDLSEQQLFAAPANAIPPIKGINDDVEDGVLAIVISKTGKAADKEVAYLQKYTPQGKQLVQQNRAGTLSPNVDVRSMLPRHTLIRVPQGQNWYPMSSEAGRINTTYWKQTDDGSKPVILSPADG